MSKILLRRDTLTNWVANNPVIGDGEMIEITMPDNTRCAKVGDGTTHFNDLGYYKGSTSVFKRNSVMGGPKLIDGTPNFLQPVPDNFVKSLCQFEGANGATTVNDSVTGLPWTLAGGASLTTTNPITGTSSLLLTSNSTAATTNIGLSGGFTSSRWTIECKLKLTSIPTSQLSVFVLLPVTVNALGVTVNTTGKLSLYANNISATWDIANITGTTTLISNTIHSIALEYTGTQYILWLNGNQEIVVNSLSVVNMNAYQLQFQGAVGTTTYIDEVRVTIGANQYGKPYTPISTPFTYTNPYQLTAASTVNTLDILGDGSCVACYTMDGNANDLSGNYNGTPTAITYAAGKFGQAGVFNGSSSYAALPAGIVSALSSTGVTVSCFFKQNTINAVRGIVSDLDSSGTNGTFEITLDASNLLRISYGAAGNSAVSGTRPITDTTSVHHIVVSFSKATSNILVYLDNVLYETISAPTGVTLVNSAAGAIGRRYSGGQYFNGMIDQMRIFNRALTANDVQAVYLEELPKIQALLKSGTVITQADGADSSGERNFISRLTSDITVNLPLSATSNVFLDNTGNIITTTDPLIHTPSFSTVKEQSTVLDIFGDGSCKALYQFEGNANDTSGNYNGTNFGSVMYGKGKYGTYAAKFTNGVAQAINLPVNTLFWSANSTVSVNVNFSIVPASTVYNIIGGCTSIAGSVAIDYYNNTLRVMVRTSGSSNITYYTPFTPVVNTYYNIVVSFSAIANPVIAINGIILGVSTYANTSSAATTLCIGSYGDNSANSTFNGTIDQVRFFNRALQPDEILALANNGSNFMYSTSNHKVMNGNPRTYLGQITTDAQKVTSIVPVPFNRTYRKISRTTAASTTYNHNLGFIPDDIVIREDNIQRNKACASISASQLGFTTVDTSTDITLTSSW